MITRAHITRQAALDNVAAIILNKSVEPTADAHNTESKALFPYFKLTRRVTTRSLKIRKKHSIFSAIDALVTIQLIYLG